MLIATDSGSNYTYNISVEGLPAGLPLAAGGALTTIATVAGSLASLQRQLTL